MNITISPPTNIEELAIFLAKLNNDPRSHVGFCGEDKEEIFQTLCHDFSDLDVSQSFAVAYEKGFIVGAIGLDIDKDDQSAEVWGPFISEEIVDSNIIEELWEQVLSYSSFQLNLVSFFLNKENVVGKEFVLKQGGVEKGQDYILKAHRSEFNEGGMHGIEKYESTYEESFSHLHNAAFPNTYYGAQEIISRLDEDNQLFIIKNDSKDIKGYVYVEADSEHGDGSIEYIAVSHGSRKQGVGTQLIKAALTYLFSYKEIEEITLCVGKENEKALNLYAAAGFKVKHDLIDFQVTKPAIERNIDNSAL